MIDYKVKFQQEIALRGLSKNTEGRYLFFIQKFINFSKTTLSKFTLDHARDFKLHLLGKGMSAQTINVAMAAIRFFLSSFWIKDGINTKLAM